MKHNTWLYGKIVKGKGLAKTMGYPTLNLNSAAVMKNRAEGVYLAEVRIREVTYNGLLYYGPRLVLKEVKTILEIYVMNFDGTVYGEGISFRIISFIRPKMNFSSLEELKKQIEKDFEAGKKILLVNSRSG